MFNVMKHNRHLARNELCTIHTCKPEEQIRRVLMIIEGYFSSVFHKKYVVGTH